MNNKLFHTLLSETKFYGLESKFYIDRVSIYIDHVVYNNNIESLEKLKSLNKNNKIIDCTLEGYIYLSKRISLFQLDQNALDLLVEIFGPGTKGDYQISYLELAMDFYSNKRSKVDGIESFFNKHLVLKHNHKYFFYRHKKNTLYYKNKEDKRRFCMYSSKPYRWNRKYRCFHLEYRFSGLRELEKLDVLTVNNLVNFEHLSFWERRLDLRRPDLKQIGIAKSANGKKISTQAVNKAGNKFFENLDNLQELLSTQPDNIALFPDMNTDNSLKKFIAKCFQ